MVPWLVTSLLLAFPSQERGQATPGEMCLAWKPSGLDWILAKWQESPPFFSTTVGLSGQQEDGGIEEEAFLPQMDAAIIKEVMNARKHGLRESASDVN